MRALQDYTSAIITSSQLFDTCHPVANPTLDRSNKLKLLKGQLKVTGAHQLLPRS